MPRDIVLPKKGLQPATERTPPDNYLSRLSKLVPVEVISAYMAIYNIVKAGVKTPEQEPLIQWIIFGVMMVLTPVYLRTVAKIKSWKTTFICWVSFLLWVLCFGGPFADQDWGGMSPQLWGSILATMYTLIIPKAAYPEFKND